jgi:DNA primase
MAGRIPEDIVDKVRDEVAIEDVIGHFVPLQRKGASFWACCPFHDEKTPSFHVHPERQIYYCFGCQRGGNVFRFLMDKEGMGFPEAVQWCAGRIGLDLERFLRDDDGRPDPRQPLYEANAWATEWFQARLREDGGQAARAYARERGLKPEIIEEFGLGFAPRDGGLLVEGAKEAKIGVEPLHAASILGRKEGRPPFAYFRSRLIFPIRGVAQKIHGFGGRILGPGEPKYLNTPETPVFKKRKTLYALPEARAELVRTRTGILVEGYLDAIALHQAGWTNSVATCGTAFAAEQAKVLGRYVDRLIVLFDGDAAGLKAAYRSAELALLGGLDVRIVRLSGGKDPAELLREGEVQALQTAIAQAPGLVECMAHEVHVRGDAREHKERALHHLQKLISRIEDPIRAELLRQEAADVFSVPIRVLAGFEGRNRNPALTAPMQGTETRRQELESNLLELAMAARRARALLLQSIDVHRFEGETTREIYEALARFDSERGAAESADFEHLSPEAQSLAARLLLEMPGEGFDAVAELRTRLRTLETLSARTEARQKAQELNEAYSDGDDWQEELRRHAAAAQIEDDPTDSENAAHGGDDKK